MAGLFFLFSLSVVGIATALAIFFVLFFPGSVFPTLESGQFWVWLGEGDLRSLGAFAFWPRIALVWATFAGGILLLSAARVIALSRGGGAAVAENLGGTLVVPGTNRSDHQTLLNVVEEMAIASGVPVPQVYVLASEPSVNAFAAGLTPESAAIGVTQGALNRLTREELQGVIAHEFSHILNGDMRSNMRLMGLLFGILAFGEVGRFILRHTHRPAGSRRGRSAGGIALFGLGLMGLGYMGYAVGHLLRCAISRQREFLADAAAVQFTRDAGGLSGALRKIGQITEKGDDNEKHLLTPRASEASHLFFSHGWRSHLDFLLASHPPLVQRVARLENLDPRALATHETSSGATFEMARAQGASLLSGGGPAPSAAMDLSTAARVLREIPEPLARALRDPWESSLLLLAAVLSSDEAVCARQIERLRLLLSKEIAELVLAQGQRLLGIDQGHRLRSLDLAMPALLQLSGPQRTRLLEALDALVAEDGQVNTREYMVLCLVERRLGVPSRLLSQERFRGSDQAAWGIVHTWTRLISGAASPDEKPPEVALHVVLKHFARRPVEARREVMRRVEALVLADGHLTDVETETVRAMAAVLLLPVPRGLEISSSPSG
jgi:Zn-dependent protease with chaperone function/uncharacterized tellurite resistance protein B-like protein